MIKYFIIILLLAVFLGIFYGDRAYNLIPVLYFTNNTKSPLVGLFTKSDLKLYNGIDKPHIYLAILGNVYDVTKGRKHYGPGQSYNVFVGRDASRSFVTGKFNEVDVTDEVTGLDEQELRSLNHWIMFYKKDYKRVGKLIGRYYNDEGKLTAYGKEIKLLIKRAEKAKDNLDLEKRKFPPCNVEWDAEKGTRVWCTARSGGIERDWTGVPRQLYEPGSQKYRCACIETNNLQQGNMKEYDGCDAKSTSCFVET